MDQVSARSGDCYDVVIQHLMCLSGFGYFKIFRKMRERCLKSLPVFVMNANEHQNCTIGSGVKIHGKDVMMTTKSETGKYLFLMRGSDWTDELSPAEIQEFVTKFSEWCSSLNVIAAHPLAREGKTVTNGGIVADGPIAEAKEAVGGFFLIEADSYEAAVELAKTCPTLDHKNMIEVRMVAEECPTFKRAAALAGAPEIKMH